MPTSLAVWEDMNQRFKRVDGNQIYQLRREICLTRHGTLSIQMLFLKLKLLWDECEYIVALMFNFSAFNEFLDM